MGYCTKDNYKDVTSIPEREEIERVLEKAGEILFLREECIGGKHYVAEIRGVNPKLSVGKSRQEAVMKAVIELGKEL